MTMRCTLSSLLLASLALPAFSLASTAVDGGVETTTGTMYKVLHRIASFDSTPEWTPRGTFDLSTTAASNATHTVQSTLSKDEVEALKTKAQSAEAGDLWYQIAVLPASASEVELSTSIKLCHLRQSHPDLLSLDDELSLTYRPSSFLVTGLSYRVLDITLDESSCPISTPYKLDLVKEAAKKERQRQLARRSARSSKPSPPSQPDFAFNTKLSLNPSKAASKLVLAQALPTNEDGTVQQPVPEKSFLQKYWYYLIPVAIMLLIPPGEEDERKQGAEGHASSEHQGKGLGAKRIK